MRGAPLPSLAASCAVLIAGCYQSHELSPCTFVPVEERCQGQPPGIAYPAIAFHATMHFPTAGECIAVVLAPELAELRPRLQRVIDELNAIECSLVCFEAVEIAMPDRRSRAIEVMRTCDECGEDTASTFGWKTIGDLCRGDLDRGVIWLGPLGAPVDAFYRMQLLGTLGLSVPFDDLSGGISPDVERSLCAMYGDPPYCGD